MKSFNARIALLCAAVAVLPASLNAKEPTWPTKPIKIVVPFAPGGSSDVTARILAEGLSVQLKQPVVIENKSGASGNIGADFVAKSAADGNTLLLAASSVHAINPSLYKAMPFRSVDDFDAVGNLTRIVHVLVVRSTLPAKSVDELIALARSQEEGLTYGSAGQGSIPHLAGEMFQRATGAKFLHVPYRGGAPANAALMGGEIDVMFTAYSNVREYITSGKLRLLATLEPRRIPSLSDVPTVSETLPGYSATGYYGLLAPKGTPPDIRKRLSDESHRLLATRQVASRLEAAGLIVEPQGPQEFEQRLRADVVKWSKHIQQSGIQPN